MTMGLPLSQTQRAVHAASLLAMFFLNMTLTVHPAEPRYRTQIIASLRMLLLADKLAVVGFKDVCGHVNELLQVNLARGAH